MLRVVVLNAAVRWVLLSALDQTDTLPVSNSIFTGNNSQAGDYGQFGCEVRTDTSAQIRARADGASTTMHASIAGWIDTRGRGA